ncbi:hypothetical protein GGI21_005656, partial [Coemansia aciculifera]
MQVDEDDHWGNDSGPDCQSAPLSSPSLNGLRLDSVESSNQLETAAVNGTQLEFSKPPESLSLRTHVSVTASRPLTELERLRDDDSFLSLTRLGGRDHGPLTCLADALVYHEIIGSQASAVASNSSAKPRLPAAETVGGGASATQVQQALASVYHLQLEAPTKYPFIYLQARDYCVVFKIVTSSQSGVLKRVAVVSQS